LESAENLEIMRLIDREYTAHPFYGSRRMASALRRTGLVVNRKRMQRLMGIMGLEAIYAKPRLSKPAPEHTIYPYLLRGLAIVRPDQVWSTDITCLPLHGGFAFLVALLDWYGRYVVAWDVSGTIDHEFCLSTLNRALENRKPEIHNSDQGAQFTCGDYVGRLLKDDITVSMDGRGRALDNVFVERLWRTVKCEDIYLKDYQTIRECIRGLREFFRFYNCERPHSSLDGATPAEVYFG
jgi:putative transposase